VTLAMPPFQKFLTRCIWTVTGNVYVKNEVRSSNTTDRMRHNIRGVKLTPASRRRYKIGLPVEGLKTSRRVKESKPWLITVLQTATFSYWDKVPFCM